MTNEPVPPVLKSAAPFIVMNELNPTWDKWYPIKEILSEMAESAYNISSNSINNLSAQDTINQNDEQKSEQVMEPMLLEDYEYGKVPQSITNIIQYLEESAHEPLHNNDLIVGFIYILMLETGFVPLQASDCDETCDFNYRRLLEQTRSIIGLRTIEGTAFMDFVLLRSVPHICSVSCVSAGDDIIVNCVIKYVATFTLMLDPLGYFTGSKKRPFQNLNQLSRKFKSSISWPAKVAILKASKVYYPSLEWIAPEIQIQIMTHLDIDSVFNLAKTCTALCQSANSVGLWIQLLNTYFRKKQKHKSVEVLQFLYEKLYEPDLSRIMSGGPNTFIISNEDKMKFSFFS